MTEFQKHIADSLKKSNLFTDHNIIEQLKELGYEKFYTDGRSSRYYSMDFQFYTNHKGLYKVATIFYIPAREHNFKYYHDPSLDLIFDKTYTLYELLDEADVLIFENPDITRFIFEKLIKIESDRNCIDGDANTAYLHLLCP